MNGSVLDWPITSLKVARSPIIFIAFFETMLGREHSGKVSNKIRQQPLFLRNHLKYPFACFVLFCFFL